MPFNLCFFASECKKIDQKCVFERKIDSKVKKNIKNRFLTKKRPKWRFCVTPVPMDFYEKAGELFEKLQNRTRAASRRPFFIDPRFCVFFDDFSSKNMFLNEKTRKNVPKMSQPCVFFVLKTFFWQKKCQKVKKHQKCVRDPQKWGPDPPFFGGGPYGVQGDFDALSWPGENVSSRGARKTYHLTPPTPGGVSDPVFGVKNTFLTRSLVIISPRTSKTSKSEAQTRVSGWFLDPKV